MQYIIAIRIIPASFVGLNTLFSPSLLLPILAPSQSFFSRCLWPVTWGSVFQVKIDTHPHQPPPPTPHPILPHLLPKPPLPLSPRLQIIGNLVWRTTCLLMYLPQNSQILIVIGKIWTFKKLVTYFLVSTNFKMFILHTTLMEVTRESERSIWSCMWLIQVLEGLYGLC